MQPMVSRQRDLQGQRDIIIVVNPATDFHAAPSVILDQLQSFAHRPQSLEAP